MNGDRKTIESWKADRRENEVEKMIRERTQVEEERRAAKRTFQIHLSRNNGAVELKRQIEAASSTEALLIALREWDQASDAQVSVHVSVLR